MLNMGGPSDLEEVHPFLRNLFLDRDLMRLPLQPILAPLIARRRSPSIVEQYAKIGGGSPILKHTIAQGEMMCKLLDEMRPESAPHKAYPAFRYARPLVRPVMQRLKEDGVKRAIAFSQYPQYSCSTTGSSLNEVFRSCGIDRDAGDVDWSVVDRWGTHPGLVEAFAQLIQTTLNEHWPDPVERQSAVILFSAHSLPMKVVNRGDPYVAEVAGSVSAVMQRLGVMAANGEGSASVTELNAAHSGSNTTSPTASKNPIPGPNPYRLVWQSQVGPQPWMGPQTGDCIKGLAKLGYKNAVLVPIAFTSDHIETLYECDVEYGHVAKEAGINMARVPALNEHPVFVRALADIVAHHLDAGERVSTQMMLRCPGCVNETCGKQKEWFSRGGRSATV
ncbi:ferrochelatase [Exidia glandulosa HHB12029]|uniref:Ferrochelatase n=1 Tax=Exidia glandulosa HHB12029 TaxID=1314781 RepID=A0A165BGN6_EXIGL|nr:ferrochelatase [Exidia glandulosa HHB12029]